jgi:hypothetical protein
LIAQKRTNLIFQWKRQKIAASTEPAENGKIFGLERKNKEIVDNVYSSSFY